MGVWDGIFTTSGIVCEVPLGDGMGFCTALAVTTFLPAFESAGGWTGDNNEYDSKLNITFVCETHKPKRLKEELEDQEGDETLHLL